MIVVDTSALMAVILKEPQADACLRALDAEDDILISAGTLVEAKVVATLRNVAEEMERLIESLGAEIVSVSPASAARAVLGYQKWGKGIHPAGLNFGDCFAYELSKEQRCPLLFVGNDFSQTDLESAIRP